MKYFAESRIKFLLMIISFLVITIFSASNVVAQTTRAHKDNLSNNKSHFIKIGISQDKHYPYYYLENGKFTGLDVEFIKEIARELNLKAQFIELPFGELGKSLQNHSVDLVISMISETLERGNKYALSIPYICTSATFLFRNEKVKNEFEAKDRLNRDPINISVNENTRYHHYALAIFSSKNLKVNVFDSHSDVLGAFESGKANITLSEDFIVRDFANRHKSSPYVVGDQAFVEKLVVFAAKNNTNLINQINPIIQKMREDGRLKALSKKYLKANLVCK